ncbi:MAG: hypothetical protein LBC56_02665 [Oscillospiraceae bacterium]|jgi:acyl-ACP thioesterase|nr:hypothetical protein [Oscillospiraceae bacterium]
MPYSESYGGKIYYEEVSIPEYSLDKGRNIKLDDFQKMLQEVAERHTLSHGCGYEELKRRGYVYYITALRISFNRRIESQERFKIYTWPQEYKGARTYRNFSVEGEAGEIVAEALSEWILLNAKTHRIENPKINPVGLATCEEKKISINSVKKIKPAEDMEYSDSRKIYYSDLDCNQHVNNSVYSRIFSDHCGIDFDKFRISDYQIDFRQETHLGDTIEIYKKHEKSLERESIILAGKADGAYSFLCRAETAAK